MKTKFFNTTLINAPMEDRENYIKEEFYFKLEQTHNSALSNDTKIIIGDFNGKIGKDLYSDTIGKHSLHQESNENGIRLIDFPSSTGMIITTTCFPHKVIHKQTWQSPYGHTWNQLDHLLIDKRCASNILDFRSFRGASCGSDHFLIRARYICHINSVTVERQKSQKINISSPKNPDKTKEFQTNIKVELNTLQQEVSPNQGINDKWTKFSKIIKDVAQNTLGEQLKTNNRDWFDEECKVATDKRNTSYHIYLNRPTRYE